MKKRTTGRKVSSITTYTAETVEDADNIAAASFDGYLADWTAWAADVLRKANLPDVARVWWHPDGRWWPEQPQERVNFDMIDSYVLNHGYAHDDIEGLAARILALAYRIHIDESDWKLKLIFDLGWICKTTGVRMRERGRQSDRGKLGADATHQGKQGVSDIIRSLAKQTDALGDRIPPSELWDQFNGELDVHGFGPVDDGDNIRLSNGTVITYDAFRRAVQRNR